jgi:beta-N-acetylhexosaminidase
MGAAPADDLGQLVMIGLDEPRWTNSCERFLSRCRPGGVLLSTRLPESPHPTAEWLRKTTLAVGFLPFLTLEEEGGKVDPLHGPFPPMASARAAARKNPSAVARVGDLVGAALKLLGFNTIFAPVLDLSTSFSEPRFGTRTFSSDAAYVARCGDAFLRGLRQHNILACGKHFPGVGGAQGGSDSKLPIVGKSMAQLWREDLVPFRQLLPQLPMVLVSQATYKAYDYDLPCSAGLSAKIVEGLLRIRLCYRGLAVAEKIEMEAVHGTLDLAEAAAKSVNAGCDLLLVRGEKNTESILAGLKKGVESGKLQPDRLQQALKRIRNAKKGLALPDGRVSAKAFDQLTSRFENFAKECRPEERKIA